MPGKAVRIRFTVCGLVAGDHSLFLAVQELDAHGEIKRRSFAIPDGYDPTWTMPLETPTSDLDYYRVRADIPAERAVPAQSNRAARYLT